MPREKSSSTRKTYGLRLDHKLMKELQHLSVDEEKRMNTLVEEGIRDLLKKYREEKRDSC